MIQVDDAVLRPIELSDANDLCSFRNDWEVVKYLGGFSAGYSYASMEEWIRRHAGRCDEILWAISEPATGKCIGHAGFYQIDYRVRKAEFAIVLGARNSWDKGLGTRVTEEIVKWGFSQLNLHKITLGVLTSNPRAIHIYEKLGFQQEGILHDEQFRDGKYVDLMLMALFRTEWYARRGETPA